ncbi:MAG: PpiC-type peptidyl-prolyl cis-trans isomerase [Petrotoga mobilis]|nr:MAG: PpiC-type peptidyl-prolyl cis-trans isomerase [Petrotoga mobilis]
MKKLLVVLGILVVLSVSIFSESVAYLTSQDGQQIYESYFLELDQLMGEYHNTLLNMLSQNPQYDQYFNKPIDLISITDVLIEYKAMEKFLNDNGITLDAAKISQETDRMYNQYIGSENTRQIFLQFFEKEEYFRGFINSLVYRNEVINELRNYFSNFSEEELSTYVSNNFENFKSQFDEVKISRIVTADENTANSIKSEILQNKISFTQAASENSLDTQTASVGGLVGWVKRGDIYENIIEASLSSAPGEIIGPISSSLGYQIVRIEDKKIYESPEELLLDNDIRNKLTTNYVDYQITNWYDPYMSNYDFVTSYKPLEIAYDIYKAQSYDDLGNVEKKYRNTILNDNELPEEWYVSYIFTVENLLPMKISQKNDLESYSNIAQSYPEFLEYSKDEINNQIEHYRQLKGTAESTDLRNEAAQKEFALSELAHLQDTYGIFTQQEIQSEYDKLYSDIEQMNIALENSLLTLREMNPDSIEIIGRLYQVKPDDPNVAFDYYSTVYSYILNYYNSTGDIESVRKDLETIKDTLNSLNTESLDKERVNQRQQILENIDQLLNQ